MEPENLPTGSDSSQSSDQSTDGESSNFKLMATFVKKARNTTLGVRSTTRDVVSDFEGDLRLDQNNAAHIDTSDDRVYRSHSKHGGRYYTLGTMDGHTAVQALRNHLNSLLPHQLVQDEFGTAVTMDEVPCQHLAKLQGKVWRELPLMVAMTAKAMDGEVTTESLIAVQSVHYIAQLFHKSMSAPA